jgi:hypothetical protein
MEKKNIEIVYFRHVRKLLIFFVLTFFFSVLSAQELEQGMRKVKQQEAKQEVPPVRDRLFFGGNFSLQLGTVTHIELAPIVGLWVLPNLAVAGGPSYTFYKDPTGQTNIYGGRGYTEYLLFRDLDKFIPLGIHTGFLLHLEDEALSLEPGTLPNTYDKTKRFLVNTLLGGVGINQQVGARASVNFLVLWTLNDSGYQIYSNPEIRISFQF